jgi:hypothetical protein
MAGHYNPITRHMRWQRFASQLRAGERLHDRLSEAAVPRWRDPE